MNNHIHPIFERMISREDREIKLNQNSLVLWFTGLSGSGKSTIAIGLEQKLFKEGYFCQILDGDNIRSGINNNLGFTADERIENIRRIAEVAKLYVNSGVITICSFISPTLAIRKMAKKIIGEQDFIEIFVNTPLSICERRDVKGLYQRARTGEIKNFTGIDAPYEPPINPQIEILTENQSVLESVDFVFSAIQKKIQLNKQKDNPIT
jgi:adenylylsulfate kinase